MRISGYILEKYNNMDGAYTCHRLIEEAKYLNIDVDIIGVCDSCITEQCVINKRFQLSSRDFIINRYKWGKVKDELNHYASNSYNNLSLFNYYVNKYKQVKNIHSALFAKPKYYLSTSTFPYDFLVSQLKSPFIAKGLENSMGREILMIKNNEDYLSLRIKYPIEKEWLFEEYIETSHGRDLRLYSIRGEAIACIMRASQNDFRANVALGATVSSIHIDACLQQIARDIYEQTKLDFVGIDLLFGRDCYYFCEINVMPGLEGVEKATGINIAKEMMVMIKKDFNNG